MVVFSYTILIICMLDLSELSNFLSMILDVQLLHGHQHGRNVHGYGTIMVNVKGLGEMDFEHDVSETTTVSSITNNSKCFRLFWTPEQTQDIGDLFVTRAHSERLRSNKCNSFITVEGALGRTGNQMFQVATLLGTAFHHDIIPVIKYDFPLARYFNLPNLVRFNITNVTAFAYHRSAKFSHSILDLTRDTNWTLRGYFQSWKYFNKAEDIIKQIFQLKDVYLQEPQRYMSSISMPGLTKVCIHVRRGDFTDESAYMKGYVTADVGFIYRAIEFHRKRWKRVRFIVLSDGKVWCKNHIKGEDILYSPFYTPAEDMALMTLCDHVVVTSGTFGWWGAWLSGGTTVYFKNYPKPGSWLDKQFDRDDYYPSNWIGL